MPREKTLYIETIRGLACLLLVAYHVVGSTSGNGLRLSDDNWMRIINGTLQDFRMPLFSFISGFVFSAVVASFVEWRSKVESKIRRLLIPMVTVSTLHYIVQAQIDREQQSYISILFMPYAHFWYLQATFLLMLTYLTLSWLLQSSYRSALAMLTFGTVFYIFLDPQPPTFFSWGKAVYLAPYFFCGCLAAFLIKKNPDLKIGREWLSVLFLAFAGATSAIYFVTTESLHLVDSGLRAARVGAGLLSCAFLMALRPESKYLAAIGSHSYAIFLFHVIFTAGARVLVWKIAPQLSPEAVFMPCLFAGVLGPILASAIIQRSRIASLLLLGIRKRDAEVSRAGHLVAEVRP